MTDSRGHQWATRRVLETGSPVLLSRPFCLNCGTVGYRASGPEPCPKAATGNGECSRRNNEETTRCE